MRRSFTRTTLLPSTTGTGSDTGTGTSLEVGTYDKGVFFLDITVGSGTSCTLDVAVQSYDVLGAGWYDVATFAQGTGATAERITAEYLGEKIRGSYSVGGTTSTFTFTVGVVLKS